MRRKAKITHKRDRINSLFGKEEFILVFYFFFYFFPYFLRRYLTPFYTIFFNDVQAFTRNNIKCVGRQFQQFINMYGVWDNGIHLLIAIVGCRHRLFFQIFSNAIPAASFVDKMSEIN